MAPDSELLGQVDHAAPHDEFKTAQGTNEPVIQETIPGTDHQVTSHPAEGVSVQIADGRSKDLDELKQDSQALAADLARQGGNNAHAHAEDVQRDVNEVPQEQQGDVAKRGMKDKLKGLRVCLNCLTS